MITTVTAESFKSEVLESDIPVLVKFFATWCGPCKMMKPAVEQIAQEKQGLLKVVEIDADTNQELAAELGIMGLPTLLLVSGGQVAKRIVGYRPKDLILNELGV